MDMQGSKIAITLPTGQTVEYELMRVGTVAEYRRLVKDSQEREIKTKKQANELAAVSARARNAVARQTELTSELAALKEKLALRKSKASALFAKLDDGKSVLSQTLAEVIGVIDEIHES
jgi:predicted  nucleic acid-binding Zn-ribbon protein